MARVDDEIIPAETGRSFARLTAGVTTSSLGDGMWLTALPLLAASMTRSPVTISLLESAMGLPWLLFGLAGGLIADRLPRRTLLWSTNALQTAVVVALTVGVATHRAGIPALVGAVFLLGAAETVFSSAFPAFLTDLVPQSRLAWANSRLATGQTAGVKLVGPAVGALLFGCATWVPLAGNAASFAVAALCVLTLPAPDTAPVVFGGIRREALMGLRRIAADPVLRVLAIANVLLGLGTFARLGVFVLFAQDLLHVNGTRYGLLITMSAVGTLTGGLAGSRVFGRLGLPRAARLAVAGGVVACAGLAFSRGWWPAAACMFAIGAVSVIWNVAVATLPQTRVPSALLGRVSAAMSLLGRGTAPLGATLGGLAAHWFGLTATLALSAGVTLLAALPLWVRRTRE